MAEKADMKISIGPITPEIPADFRDTHAELRQKNLTVVVLGASGDLAKKKTYPSLLALFKLGYLPSHVHIVGYARSKLSLEEFHARISPRLNAEPKIKEAFLSKCTYFAGQYDKEESFEALTTHLQKLEAQHPEASGAVNRVFYFALPPSVFASVSECVKSQALTTTGWNRIIIEKPFGRDLESSEALSKVLLSAFTEEQIYRIDHYLGKEMVQNLMVLRFSNMVFEPLWNRNNIQAVVITFKENFGTQGRGGYFDKFGIIRDVIQNHLMQVLSLVAMEAPVSLSAEDVRDEKVKVLRCIRPILEENVVLGQYVADADGTNEGYRDDPTVDNGSVTPTYAMCVLYIDNPRWAGVPFILKAGKAMNERKAEVRLQFRTQPGSRYKDPTNNELVVRIQPKEAIYLRLTTKKPGLCSLESTEQSELDLTYKHRFKLKQLPDAYTRLLLDVLRGDHNLFVRGDELHEAWRIFTPLLHKLEAERKRPEDYVFGSRGLESADKLSQKVGYAPPKGNYHWQSSVPESPPALSAL